jgi:hypothetical protein
LLVWHDSNDGQEGQPMSQLRIGSNATAARHDVIRLLHHDHQRVLQAFDEFEDLHARRDRQTCQHVAQRTFAVLKVLAEVERQLFYPAIHPAIAGTDLIEQSQIEHARIQRVVSELEWAEPGQAIFWQRFRTLGKYVRRHIEDEEAELFPMLSCVPIDWQRLYDKMTARRAELAEELGVSDALPKGQPTTADDPETQDPQPALAFGR